MARSYRSYELNGETIMVEDCSKKRLFWYRIVDKFDPYTNWFKYIVLNPELALMLGFIFIFLSLLCYGYWYDPILNVVLIATTSFLFTFSFLSTIIRIRKSYRAKH